MAYTLVQSKGASGNSGTSLTVSGLTATTQHNQLVALLSVSKNPGDVTFTPPANWVQAGTTFHDDTFISVSTAVYYYPDNPGGITSVSFTSSSAASAWHLTILEFNGPALTSPLDGTSVQQHGNTLSPTSGAITTTAAGDLVIGWSELDEVSGGGDCTVTQPAAFPNSLTRLNDSGGWTSSFVAWGTQTSAGSISYSPTKSRSDTEGVFTIVAFKAASGGSSVQGQASLSASAALTSAAVETYAAASNLSAAASLSPSAVMSLVGAASLASGLSLSPSGVLAVIGSAALSGALNLSADAVLSLVVAAALSASLDLSATGDVAAGGGTAGSAALAASAVLQASGVVKYAGQANLSASATLSAQAVMTLAAQIVLGASAGMTAAGARAVTGQAGLSGEASLNVAAALSIAAQAAVSAGLSLDVQARLAVVGASALAASLSLSATGQHNGVGIFENVTASILLLAAMSASLATPTFPLTADVALLNVGPEGTVA